MRSIKRSLGVLGAIVALTAHAPVAVAGTHHPFHIDKTCADAPSEPLGFICTVQHSSVRWLPAGTDVHYLSQNDAGDVMQLAIEIANGSTRGACSWTSDRDATCVFAGGIGRLTQLHLEVVVTASPDLSVWYWDGSSWFGD